MTNFPFYVRPVDFQHHTVSRNSDNSWENAWERALFEKTVYAELYRPIKEGFYGSRLVLYGTMYGFNRCSIITERGFSLNCIEYDKVTHTLHKFIYANSNNYYFANSVFTEQSEYDKHVKLKHYLEGFDKSILNKIEEDMELYKIDMLIEQKQEAIRQLDKLIEKRNKLVCLE